MKLPTYISLLGLGSQATAIPASLKTANTTSKTPSTRPEFSDSVSSDTGGNSESIGNSPTSFVSIIPTTLITSTLTPTTHGTAVATQDAILEPRSSTCPCGLWNVVYYGSWTPTPVLDTLPWEDLSHILFAFAAIDKNGTVYLKSPQQDELGIRKLTEIKNEHRHVKVLLSIGGYAWSNDEKMFDGAVGDAFRVKFAQSSVDLMQTWGFDGLDIDWEYPNDKYEAFVDLLKATRHELTRFEREHDNGYQFPLTIATGALTSSYREMDWAEVDKLVDAWFHMGYDYSGTWLQQSAHSQNLKGETSETGVEISGAASIEEYIGLGVSPEKIIMGIPIYGHSFVQTGHDFSVPFTKPQGDGAILYKDMDLESWTCGTEYELVSAWCHDGTHLISYDNPETVALKTEWAVANGLGGTMFWQASGDKPGRDSLISAARKKLPSLHAGKNMIEPPKNELGNVTAHDIGTRCKA